LLNARMKRVTMWHRGGTMCAVEYRDVAECYSICTRT